MALQETYVRRNAPPLAQENQVSRNELAGVDLDLPIFPADEDRQGKQTRQGLQLPLRPVLLPEREDRVDDDYSDDRPAEELHSLPRPEPVGGKGDPSRDPQEESEEVRELSHEQEKQRRPGGGLQDISAVERQALNDLSVRETLRMGP